MRKDKEIATELRRSGMSYEAIRAKLNIPKSTLAHWFGGEEWSHKLASRLSANAREMSRTRLVKLNRIRGEALARIYEEARNEAREELARLKYDPVFVAGMMLYWGEGGKNVNQGVKFSNSDPQMISFYVQFLERSCGLPLESIKANLLIYPDIEEKTARAYWSKKSGIPWENFTKTTVLAGRHATRRLGWGVCTVTVSSAYLKQKFLTWITLLPEQLLVKEYYENI